MSQPISRIVAQTVTAIVAWVLLGCGGGEKDSPAAPPRPRENPGPVNVVLLMPNAADAALFIRITGGPITSVTAVGSLLRTLPAGTTPSAFIIRGDIRAGLVAVLEIPDRNKLASYRAEIVQAVEARTYVQRDVAGYQATLAKQ